MGPLRGDGNPTSNQRQRRLSSVEKMGPLRGDGNCCSLKNAGYLSCSREDGSPSWGRKHQGELKPGETLDTVEKMGPLRGDGNLNFQRSKVRYRCREDGSPSWGRKLQTQRDSECKEEQ